MRPSLVLAAYCRIEATMMKPIAMLLVVAVLSACSESSDGGTRDKSDPHEIEDGTLVNSQHRQIVNDYFEALSQTTNAADEKKVISDFAAWLNEHGYKLQVEPRDDGSVRLLCPHMPPQTPWTAYEFRDARHLGLLPRHSDQAD
jgi:hypothetical protein